MAKTKTQSPSDLPALRAMITARMLERGGGAMQQRLVDAAKEIGVSHTALSRFLSGDSDISVEMCIRLANYLDHSVPDVLTLAGFTDVATIIKGSKPRPITSHALELQRIIQPLNDSQRSAVLGVARNTANVLRATKTK